MLKKCTINARFGRVFRELIIYKDKAGIKARIEV